MSMTRRGFFGGAAASLFGLTSCKEKPSDTTRASNQDVISSGFFEIKEIYPTVGDLRRTVCQINSSAGIGSAVLLDKQGVLATSADCISSSGELITLSFFPDTGSGPFHTQARVVLSNKETNTVLLQLVNTDDVKRYQLRPVTQWGKFADGSHKKAGETFVAAGYFNDPQGNPTFHGSVLKLDRYVPSGTMRNSLNPEGIGDGQQVHCQMLTFIQAGSTVSPGMGGGGIFSTDGFFLGTLTGARGTEAAFTPVDAIGTAYDIYRGASSTPTRALKCPSLGDGPQWKL